jgi:hypothetical protein
VTLVQHEAGLPLLSGGAPHLALQPLLHFIFSYTQNRLVAFPDVLQSFFRIYSRRRVPPQRCRAATTCTFIVSSNSQSRSRGRAAPCAEKPPCAPTPAALAAALRCFGAPHGCVRPPHMRQIMSLHIDNEIARYMALGVHACVGCPSLRDLLPQDTRPP